MGTVNFSEPVQLIRKANETLAAFSNWFEQHVVGAARVSRPPDLDSWKNELEAIRSLLKSPKRIRIALVGTTGSGKSTLLNAVLGQELLPVGVMKPCTAFVTTVRYSVGPEYGLKVQYCSREEWRNDLEVFLSALHPADDEEEADRRLMEVARKRIQAVYGQSVDDFSADRLPPLPEEVEKVFSRGSVEKLVFNDVKPMLAHLRKLVRGDSSLWPLVKEVNISGPYEVLQGGLELVDLPGLNDPNEARVEVTKKFLRSSPFVWIVFSMVRGLTDDIQRILKEEKLLRAIILQGQYQTLSLVGTRADEIDTNLCEQFGLDEGCTIAELVREYRKRTVVEARRQLKEMVRDIAAPGEDNDTLSRMIRVAENVTVHTTSASAYNKLKGIGRLRKDYGLECESETGIPEIHEHLLEIARNHGAAFNARMALKRLDKLREEIAFFFRAKSQPASQKLDEAHSWFAKESESLDGKLDDAQKKAKERLKNYRERFLERIDPYFAQSVQGVEHSIQGWRSIHWATLKAIAQRNGSFRSPTSGRHYDFNTDIAEPLLAKLPVAWEQYFTDDLGKVTYELAIQVSESVGSFCDKILWVCEKLFGRSDKRLKEQMAWFQEKIALMTEESKNRIVDKVSQKRRELAESIPRVVQKRMMPAYEKAKREKGGALKKRLLGHLEPAAIGSARPIYDAIQQELVEGLRDLEMILHGLFQQLVSSAVEQAQHVVNNANITIQELSPDRAIENILATMPKTEFS